MQAASAPYITSKPTLWSARILGAVAILFLIFDSVIKVLNVSFAAEATTKLGYPASATITIGILELVCLVIYIFPRTAILGAILLTGYLGGAIATHVRAGSDIFSVIFPVIIGALLWGAIYLVDQRLRDLVPLRR